MSVDIKSLSLPPGPRGGKFGLMWRRSSDFPGLVVDLHKEYGDLVYFEIPGMKNLLVFEADLSLEVYQREPTFEWANPPSVYHLLDGCLPACRGEEHAERRILMEAAVTDEKLKQYSAHIVRSARSLKERCRPGAEVQLRYEMEEFMWRGLLDSILGPELKVASEDGKNFLICLRQDILMSVLPGSKLLAKLPLPHNRRVKRFVANLDRPVYHAIERARDPEWSGEDVATFMVRAHDEGVVDWEWKSDKDIRDELVVLITGFSDAPVAALVCGAHHLARHPEARAKVEAEVDRQLGGRPVEVEDFARLPYLRAVCAETLRITSPAYVLLPRRTTEECELGGFRIPKGTVVHVGALPMHVRKDYWGDDAADFRPERWLQQAHPGCPAHAFTPFGYEHRICPWRGFAERMFVYGLAELAQDSRFEFAPDTPVEMRSFGVGLTSMVPATVTARPRA